MYSNENDFDRFAVSIDEVMQALVGGTYEPSEPGLDHIMIDKNEYLRAVVRLQRLRNWIKGHAESHRMYASEET